MATPYRGYSEIPGAVTPDVPYRVNLALREIDADVEDAVKELERTDATAAGRLAALEIAAGFGSGMQLQDDAVNALLLDGKSSTHEAVRELASGEVTQQLDVPASPVREAVDELVLGHLGENFHGPLRAWGEALRARATKPAIWVSLGSSTANGGNTANFALSWVGRIATYLTGAHPGGSVKGLDGTTARPGAGVHVYNGAVGGTTSSNYLNTTKIAAIKKLQPTLITHMVGANDLGGGVALSTYKNNLRNWMDQLQAASPNSVHLFIHQQGRVAASPKIAWDEYGKAMREVAELYPNAAFFDASERFGWNGLASHFVSDNLHMNANGHKIMADLVAEVMGNPIPYVSEENYRAEVLNGGAVTEGHTWTTVKIPAAPYPRRLKVHANVYCYGTGGPGSMGPDLHLLGKYDDDQTDIAQLLAIRVLNGGVGYAQTYAATPVYEIEANRSVTYTVSHGGAIYFSNNNLYNELNITASPS